MHTTTSQRCSECTRGRHANLNAPENPHSGVRRESEPCTDVSDESDRTGSCAQKPAVVIGLRQLLVEREQCSTRLMLAVCGEEGSTDKVTRAGTYTVGHNSVATTLHAKASLGTEETRNLHIHFADFCVL
ncbi:MAG: hypothetical protein J07HQX50_01969, partial [Haloquadratum sp. J07HQX50]